MTSIATAVMKPILAPFAIKKMGVRIVKELIPLCTLAQTSRMTALCARVAGVCVEMASKLKVRNATTIILYLVMAVIAAVKENRVGTVPQLWVPSPIVPLFAMII